MDKAVDEKRGSISGQEEGLDADRESRSVRSSIFSEEVLVRCKDRCTASFGLFLLCLWRNQIRQELTVEGIVQRRSWEGKPRAGLKSDLSSPFKHSPHGAGILSRQKLMQRSENGGMPPRLRDTWVEPSQGSTLLELLLCLISTVPSLCSFIS